MDEIIFNGLALNLIEIKVLNYGMNFKILQLLIFFIYHFYKIKFILNHFIFKWEKQSSFLRFKGKNILNYQPSYIDVHGI